MLLLTLALACAPKPSDDSAAPADSTTDSAPQDSAVDSADTAVDPCAEAPTVTYANFGRGFMTGNCQGCHASTAADRYDAPESVTFDDVTQCWDLAPLILDAAAGADPSMPPQGGVTDDDRQLLWWWLSCADPGT